MTLRGHKGLVQALALSVDGEWLYSGSGFPGTQKGGGEIKLWNVRTGKEILTLRGHTGQVECLALSADGKRLFSGGGLHDNTIKIWDLEAAKETVALRGHTASVKCLALSPDGRLLFSGSADGTIRVWDFGCDEHLDRGEKKQAR